MKGFIKWLVIAAGAFIVLVIAAVLIVPQFIDVKKYKPVIEEKVAQATGRTFSLGDEIDLSVFPWVGVRLTDLHLGNGQGFEGKDMVSVKSFEVRLKVMPLLSKKIEVKTFVMDSPMIYLEKMKTGKANWQGIGAQQDTKTKKPEKSDKTASQPGQIPVAALFVGNFSITNGKIIYSDAAAGLKKEISDLNLTLKDISFENPVKILFSAVIDGKPVSLEGLAGPVGRSPGQVPIPVDFSLKALNELELNLKGSLNDLLSNPGMDLNIDVAAFSPKKLFSALKMDFPVRTKDPKVLDSVAFKSSIKGSAKNIDLSSGVLKLDDSTLNFSASVKEFSRPDVKFDLQLDQIDLDRYLPEAKPAAGKEEVQSPSSQTAAAKTAGEKPDYTPLRQLVLDGSIKAGKVKASGALVENIDVQIKAKNGIISIEPLKMDLYKGSIVSKLEADVQRNIPETRISISAKEIQAGPLLKDVSGKESIEGAMQADVDISTTGDTPDIIKKSLNGKGLITFTDGAIVGIDLANMVRNVKSSFGMGEQVKEKPKTDFAELKIPFTAVNGLVNTSGTSLASPLIRVLAKGDVNLVKELLDLRIEPKFVATLTGQGDNQQRSGLMVPVLVTGSFQSPKIRPDLKGMITSGGSLPDVEQLKKQIIPQGDSKPDLDTVKEDAKKQVKGLLKGLVQ